MADEAVSSPSGPFAQTSWYYVAVVSAMQHPEQGKSLGTVETGSTETSLGRTCGAGSPATPLSSEFADLVAGVHMRAQVRLMS